MEEQPIIREVFSFWKCFQAAGKEVFQLLTNDVELKQALLQRDIPVKCSGTKPFEDRHINFWAFDVPVKIIIELESTFELTIVADIDGYVTRCLNDKRKELQHDQS